MSTTIEQTLTEAVKLAGKAGTLQDFGTGAAKTKILCFYANVSVVGLKQLDGSVDLYAISTTDTAEQMAAKMNKPWKTLEAQTH